MRILEFFESVRNPVLNYIFSFFTFLGEEYVFLVLSLAVLWCVNKKYGYCLLFAGIIGQNANQFLKYFFKVERPWVAYPNLNPVSSAIENAGGYSFPSGHTQIAATTYGTLAYFYRDKRILSMLYVAMALLVGISRMYLGVHYFTDVMFSLVFGAIIVLLSCKAFERETDGAVFRVITLVASAALVVYTVMSVGGEFMNENDFFALEFSSKFFGAGVAFVISWCVDEKFLKYETKANVGFQCFKLFVGAAIVVALRFLLKKAFLLVGIEQTVGDMMRYFLLVIFAGIVWPWIFSRLNKTNFGNKLLKK